MQMGRVQDNQRGWILKREAANEVLELRRLEGFTIGNSAAPIVTPAGDPTVYVLAINGNRLKLGFTDSFEQRLTSHRTMVPDLEILRRWRLTPAYEAVMIGIVTNCEGVRRLGPEVFEMDAATRHAVLARLDELVRWVGVA